MKCYQENYPRPQFVRKQWESYNGIWDFAFDDQHIGESDAWYQTFPTGISINVPFTYETKLSGIGDETLHSCVWYHRQFDVDNTKLKSHNFVIHFEGCDYISKVWINGQYVGSHTGAYTRFSYDITPFVQDGINDIVVEAFDDPSVEQMRGKQRWKNENYGVFYTQITGIWKTVWSEYVPKTHIDAVKMTPHIDAMQLEIEASIVRNFSDAKVPLLFEAIVSYDGHLVNRMMTTAHLSDIRMSIDLRSEIANTNEFYTKLWTPDNPHLYDITFRLYNEQTLLDDIGSYFAMREITIEGQHILLNGLPIYQRLLLDQGYWTDSLLTPPDENALIHDIEQIKNLGYNGVRKHQKVEDERFFYWCDVMGLFVWCEAPSYFHYTNRTTMEFTSQWVEIVKQYYNHPCIITWTPFNESWGIFRVKRMKEEQYLNQAIYYLTKNYDPYRPVVTNDGWEHTLSDIITIHDYNQDGHVLKKYFLEHKDEILSSTVTPFTLRAAFADGFSYKGQPVIISEYGGISIESDIPGWGYGNMVTREEFIPRYEAITTAIKEIPYVCGFCYTQFSDVQQEINGMVDMDRNYKINPDIIRDINLR